MGSSLLVKALNVQDVTAELYPLKEFPGWGWGGDGGLLPTCTPLPAPGSVGLASIDFLSPEETLR